MSLQSKSYTPNLDCPTCGGWNCMVESPRPGHPIYIAIDPATGARLRLATRWEIAAYRAQPKSPPFDVAMRVGDVTIDTYCGPGGAHIPGRFLP